MFRKIKDYMVRSYVNGKRMNNIYEFSLYNGLSEDSAEIMTYMDLMTGGDKRKLSKFDKGLSLIDKVFLKSSEIVRFTGDRVVGRMKRLHRDKKFRERVFGLVR